MELTQLRVFEPEPGKPVDPMVAVLLRKVRRMAVGGTVFGLAAAALSGAVLAFPAWSLTWPVMVVAIVVPGGLAVWMARLWWLNRRGLRLGDQPVRRIDLAQGTLRRAGRTASFPIAIESGDWVVVNLPEAHLRTLERERRVGVVGPERTGRVLVLVPGCALAYYGRIRQAGRGDAVAVPPESAELAAPARDAVLAAWYRQIRRGILLTGSAGVVAAAWIVTWFLLDPTTLEPVSVFVAVYLAVVGPAMSIGLLPYRKALKAAGWTPLSCTLGDAPDIRPSGLVRTGGWARLPDGTTLSVRLVRASLDVYVNVRVSGQLWVLGEARPGTVVVGVPGHPVLGTVKLEGAR